MSLANINAPMKVTVVDFHQISEDIGVISFMLDHDHKDNLYHIADPTVMQTLISVRTGNKVEADLTPADNTDGHPHCVSAVVVPTEVTPS